MDGPVRHDARLLTAARDDPDRRVLLVDRLGNVGVQGDSDQREVDGGVGGDQARPEAHRAVRPGSFPARPLRLRASLGGHSLTPFRRNTLAGRCRYQPEVVMEGVFVTGTLCECTYLSVPAGETRRSSSVHV